MIEDLASLEEALGYNFNDLGLLRQALVHRSYLKDDTTAVSNERLEFLGDAVLGWIVADYTFKDAADYPEGKLTDIRKTVVNANALTEVANSIGLGAYLAVSKADDRLDTRLRSSVLSDAMEAVIAAVYLDGGITAAYDLVVRLLAQPIEDAAAGRLQFDYKSLIQEWAAQNDRGRARYRITMKGAAHEPEFHAKLEIDGEELGEGFGPTKKAAEQVAAEQAYKNLNA